MTARMCGSTAASLRLIQMRGMLVTPRGPPRNAGSSIGGFSGMSPSRCITRTELSAIWGGFSRKRSSEKNSRMNVRKTRITPVTSPIKNFAMTNPTVARAIEGPPLRLCNR